MSSFRTMSFSSVVSVKVCQMFKLTGTYSSNTCLFLYILVSCNTYGKQLTRPIIYI